MCHNIPRLSICVKWICEKAKVCEYRKSILYNHFIIDDMVHEYHYIKKY